MGLAERIRDLRLSKGWIQSELARAADIPQPTIWRLERGAIDHPKADTLMALARALEVPVDLLVHEEYERHPAHLLITDSVLRQMVEEYARMPDENRGALRGMIRLLASAGARGRGWRDTVYRVKPRRVRRE